MNNKLFRSKLSLVIAASFLTACGPSSDTEKASAANVKPQAIESTQTQTESQAETVSEKLNQEQLFKEATQILFQNRPISASLYGVSDEIVGVHSKAKMDDYSGSNEAALRANLGKVAAQLSKMSADGKLNEENRQVVLDIVNYYAGAKAFPVGFIDAWMGHSPFIVNQINGPLIDIPNTLINSHTITNENDAKDYLTRLSAFEQTLASINEKLKEDEQQNWTPPKIIIQRTLSYLKGYVKTKPSESTLVLSFVKKLNALEPLDQKAKEKMIKEAEQLVEKVVYSGYQQITQSLETMQSKATTESGIWAQPNGAEFYRYSISKLGDTDMSPDEIHQIGLAEVHRITQTMDKILKEQGYETGSVGERMQQLNNEERFLFPNTDKGRADLLDSLNDLIKEISAVMPQQFASVPPYPVEVKRIPIATQDSSAGGYYTPPTVDGSVPGIYWINLKDTKNNPKFDLNTLTYHEAIPGHHWQVALNLAQEQLPLLRRIAPYNAYVEGWALYSEQVAYEMGLYKDRPFANLGRLKAELFRAVRLVVDTGMHAKKWSREKAIEFMASTTGTEKSDVISEIERYMVWPGQALGYKLGMLKINSLRRYAKEKLGDKFDIKQFHDVVLLSGAVPMKVLDTNVKAWVKETLK